MSGGTVYENQLEIRSAAPLSSIPHKHWREANMSNESPADDSMAKISDSELICKCITSELFDFEWVIEPNFKISLSPKECNDASFKYKCEN